MDNTPITSGTPAPAPAPTPAPNQIPGGPMPQQTPQPIANAPINNQNSKKKLGIILGCIAGIIAAVITILVLTLPQHTEKTISCTDSNTIMGISIDIETNIKIKDGGISSGDVIVTANLNSMSDSYKKHEKTIVDKITERYKNDCGDSCNFDYVYNEGDNVKYTLHYEKEGVNKIIVTYGTGDMNAQEIANKTQETLENSGMTCTQK